MLKESNTVLPYIKIPLTNWPSWRLKEDWRRKFVTGRVDFFRFKVYNSFGQRNLLIYFGLTF